MTSRLIRPIWSFVLGMLCCGLPTGFAAEQDSRFTLTATRSQPETLTVYVGTYTSGKSEGIYRLHLHLSSGKLSLAGVTSDVVNPSFLAVHPTRRFLYAVNEVGNSADGKSGSVSAFSIQPKTGKLTLLNQQSSGDGAPCHLVVDKRGRNVLVANYWGGSVAVLPIGKDGRLAERSAFVQHAGSSVNPQRQEAPHAHSINLDSANQFAFAADLGLDQVLVYRFDSTKGCLVPNQKPSVSVAAGSGPRHFAFHPSGRYAYVINELALTVTAFRYNAGQGILTAMQTISTLPGDAQANYSTAEVQVHPSGRFLYGSNRGHHSIAIFAIDERTGLLDVIGHQSTLGKTPRNFGIDPTGTYLLAANQGSDTIVVFDIDAKTGQLKPVGEPVAVPSPVCVKFVAVSK